MMVNWLYRVSWIGLILVYLVILAGSVVRMTGSGMGCPDWPKCFGKWIPPTDVSELPEDYKKHYSEKREKKIEEFSVLLEKIGFKSEAELIRNDKSLLEEEDFNTFKTWTEYVNRLVGFLAGNFFLLAVILSLFLLRKRKLFFILSFFNLVLIGFQAWFGSIVVATNLLPWTITLHMFLALLIVVVHLQLIRVSSSRQMMRIPSDFNNIKWLFLGATVLTVVQVFFGTQVRQEVDSLLSNQISRGQIAEEFGITFYIHRSFSILVLLLNVFMFYKLRNVLTPLLKVIFAIIFIEIVLGVVMFYGGMPAWTQPFHLVLATILFGIQIFWLLEVFLPNREFLTNRNNED